MGDLNIFTKALTYKREKQFVVEDVMMESMVWNDTSITGPRRAGSLYSLKKTRNRKDTALMSPDVDF